MILLLHFATYNQSLLTECARCYNRRWPLTPALFTALMLQLTDCLAVNSQTVYDLAEPPLGIVVAEVTRVLQ